MIYLYCIAIDCLHFLIFITFSRYFKRLWPWSLAALCGLGFVLFLIALTIVLSLIPVYLSRRDISLSNGNDREYSRCSKKKRNFYLSYTVSDLFYLEYATTADSGSTGFANNLEDVSQQV